MARPYHRLPYREEPELPAERALPLSAAQLRVARLRIAYDMTQLVCEDLSGLPPATQRSASRALGLLAEVKGALETS